MQLNLIYWLVETIFLNLNYIVEIESPLTHDAQANDC